MTPFHIFTISFGIFNLCLLVFCRQLAPLVLKFFVFSRTVCPPEKAKKQATKFGYEGVFSNSATYSPTRKQAIGFLAWTGVINFFCCIGIYYLLHIETIENTQKQETIEKSLDETLIKGNETLHNETQ